MDPAARFVAPTVTVEPSPDSPVMQEEIFGPILPVLAIAIIVPIFLFWAFAVMIRRAQELKLAARSMTVTPSRAAHRSSRARRSASATASCWAW